MFFGLELNQILFYFLISTKYSRFQHFWSVYNRFIAYWLTKNSTIYSVTGRILSKQVRNHIIGVMFSKQPYLSLKMCHLVPLPTRKTVVGVLQMVGIESPYSNLQNLTKTVKTAKNMIFWLPWQPRHNYMYNPIFF